MNSTNTTRVECVWNLSAVEWAKLAMLFAGVFGNGITFVVIICYKSLHSVTYAVICSIAIADFCYCTSAVIWQIVIIGYLNISRDFRRYVQCVDTVFYEFVETFVSGLLSLSYVASVLFVALLSIFRFIIITKPLKSKLILNKRVTIFAIMLVWALSIANAVWKKSSVHDLNSTISHIVDMLVTYVVPLIVILIFHIMKIASLRNSQFGNSMKSLKRMERIVAVIIFTFVVLPFPWQLFRMLHVFGIYDAGYLLQTTSGFSLQINNCINPIFYAFLSPTVRKAVIKMFSFPFRRCCRNNCQKQNDNINGQPFTVTPDTDSTQVSSKSAESVSNKTF